MRARVRLAEGAGGEFAPEAANRFLNWEAFSGKGLYEEARPLPCWRWTAAL